MDAAAVQIAINLIRMKYLQKNRIPRQKNRLRDQH